MPVLLKAGIAALFVHVPKTGGTSIERFFVQNGWSLDWRDGVAGEGTLNSYLKCSPQHVEARRLAELFRLEKFDLVFSTVREPIARFRSEYCMRNAADLRTDPDSVDAWGESALAAYAADGFVFDNHLRPQHEFIVPGASVYRLEAGLQSMVEDLNARFDLGLTGDLPRASDREMENGVSSRDVVVSDRLEKRLRDLYARDFHDFEY
ncbi:hypothetical protein EXE59_21460 [Nocardioides eburneiflavus]|uniref:Sulfotransferase family protein n=1 Tax=Nocardioides eburneiflavus TaxID=2518372 RepID=A0A4Z1C774_9ACTN|nr:sulfotransferase family 2 domain-containing protein [Nocardioides eburneiflavus]TGN66234.1 hypothetical protein EXE59_21460 [Nocardioides eburneiflavus]